MYMTNEEWEQNNQDYLKESYEETGFTTGGYAVRKLICGGCGRVFYTTIYTKKYCHSYWCGNQANNRRQREYRQMRRQDLVCQCCGEKFTPKRADARYCSNSCRQKVYRKRVTDAASTQNEHIVFRTVSRSVENQAGPVQSPILSLAWHPESSCRNPLWKKRSGPPCILTRSPRRAPLHRCCFRTAPRGGMIFTLSSAQSAPAAGLWSGLWSRAGSLPAPWALTPLERSRLTWPAARLRSPCGGTASAGGLSSGWPTPSRRRACSPFSSAPRNGCTFTPASALKSWESMPDMKIKIKDRLCQC